MEVVLNRTREHWLFTWTVTNEKGVQKTYFVSEGHINVQVLPTPEGHELTNQIFTALRNGVPVRCRAAYSKPILTIKPGETDADMPVATKIDVQVARAHEETTAYFARQEANLKALCAQAAIFKELGVV